MTEPVAGAPLTEEQRAFLLASQAQQAAASPSPAAEAAGAQAVMESGPRGPMLPAEEQMDSLMAQFRQQSEQLAAAMKRMDAMSRQIGEYQAATGGPLTVRYAQGAADKIDAMAAAHPNNPLGLAHFDQARDAAARLLEAATSVSKGSGPLHLVKDAAADVERFAARVHKALGGMHVDWSAILDDVDLAVSEALKLAA